MKPSRRRLVAAAGLTCAVVLLPCLAWYSIGSRDAAREVARLRRAAVDRAGETANLLAMRAATLLENLRERESNRPYARYGQTPEEADLDRLAGLLEARYAIDARGFLIQVHNDAENLIRDKLAPLTQAIIDSVEEAPYLEEILEESDLDVVEDKIPAHAASTVEESLLVQGPFVWRTVSLDGIPTLTAAREVTTSRRTIVQGFVVSTPDLEEAIGRAALPARLVHGVAGQQGESDIPVPGTAWRVVVDAGPALESAALQATAVRRNFKRTFVAGSSLAVLAGICLLAMTVQSERLSRLRARFAAAAAHELRSPLATIRLHSEMLADNLGRPDLAREYAGRVADEVERLGRVVTNALGYSRMEEGTLRIHPEIGDLAGAIQDQVGLMRRAMELSGASVDLKIEEPLPPVSFDPDAMQHVMQNLLDNAEKFSRRSDDRTVHVELFADGDDVVLRVTDHGPGVPPHARRFLFRPAARETGRGADQGLGLGLVLVHALVKAMDGRIHYEAPPDGGARFTLRFPASEPLLMDTPD